MSAASQLPLPPRTLERSGDRRFLLHGIPWQIYLSLREADDSPGLRMTYDRGNLELMSPSPEHEDLKTTLARLIEVYAIERDVPLYGYGSTTFRRQAKEQGLEPDECYCLGGKLREVPDFALEVVLTSGTELKLVFPQAAAMPERFVDLDFQHFFLQPMDGLQGKRNTRLAVEYCLAHPQWRLSVQTHKVIGIA